MIHIERLQESDFFKMETEWNGLLGKSAADSFFLSWEWMTQWWRSFGNRKEPLILVAHDSQGLCGIAPLLIEKKYYFKHFPVMRIGFLGSDMVHSDYLDFIAKPGREKAVAESVLDYLCNARFDWDLLELTGTLEQSLALNSIVRHARTKEKHSLIMRAEICPYLTLPSSADGYLSALSTNNRYNIRRRTQNLFKHFGDTQVLLREHTAQEDPELMNQLMGDLFRLHRIRWGNLNKKTIFGLPEVERFHRQLLPTIMKKGSIAIYSLSLGGQLAGVIYGYVYGRKYYFYQSGFDPQFASYSPGLVLMSFSIERVIQRGLCEYDFLRGEEAYKSKFTKNSRQTSRVEIWNNKAKRKYMDCIRRIRAALSKLKKVKNA